MSTSRTNPLFIRRQRGAALMVMLVILIMGSAAFLVGELSSIAPQLERDKRTAEALSQAKEALIGYAASVDLSDPYAYSPRPGNLPCPDFSNTGTAALTCSGSALGRLPWKTLGLPDLRDGSGERLWYAVSSNFRKLSSGTPCSTSGDPDCLNSDTLGTITVRAPDGAIIYDGSASNGLAAVIVAPGNVLQRTDKTSPQDRSTAGENTPDNYLDIALGEDNATFSNSSTNGFIQGTIRDGNGNVILNDQLLAITQDSIMQAAQKRVAKEVQSCLTDYALNNLGRYPWAAQITDLTSPYGDSSGTYFGRIPDTLSHTDSDIEGATSSQWTISCKTHITNTPAKWWLNWKEMVFYGLSNTFRPSDTTAPAFPSTCATSGNCLSVNSATSPARIVVIVAGKALSNPNQLNRNTNKTNAFSYLEGGNESANQSGAFTFIQSVPSATFNDLLISR
jgi:type II secretory pathway pseudopilin PulG